MIDEEAGKALEKAVEPVHKWLCENGHPHMCVIIEQCGARVCEEVIGTPLPGPD